MTDYPSKFILLILDGLGLRDVTENNAFRLARTPTFDRLFNTCPWSILDASQNSVGLPNGVIGNSEVGHMTIGAGRIIKQDLVRINDEIKSDRLKDNNEIKKLFSFVKERNSNLHLMGLVSDGGVHSHLNHILPILKCAKIFGVKNVYIHFISDGRDASPYGSLDYYKILNKAIMDVGIGEIATIIGRYYAMDRDKRWDRTESAYDLYILGKGEKIDTVENAIVQSHADGITDEFIKPFIINGIDGRIGPDDAVLCFNYRADRMRQICSALGSDNFIDFKRETPPVRLTSMTSYHKDYNFPILFRDKKIDMKLGQVIEKLGLRQLRVAETEKYAHVTYFLNGGDEDPYDAEERLLVPSPKVATYDLQPEMSAFGIRDAVLNAMHKEQSDAIVMNIANTDMVGHTGNLKATIRAAEVADEVLGDILKMAESKRTIAFVTADHGNCEVMLDESTGRKHTAHTLNPVPFIVVNGPKELKLRSNGGLSDVSPTILNSIGAKIPQEMTGKSLIYDIL
ncbi:MAG: phosphoglycerate mutase (2,3-diphosphoglycerate-independent) [Candidatus Marinimicrobia bacterium]|nr:phosphoglycerate mutase (2,3-diphosphoglycerate-independent) [Candidatus Neomarinimicrobiota bacterium]|tara:strand:+ start:1389 stop:2924 length:1536 start_codon:yes stop_codon:yes gene_type:complete